MARSNSSRKTATLVNASASQPAASTSHSEPTLISPVPASLARALPDTSGISRISRRIGRFSRRSPGSPGEFADSHGELDDFHGDPPDLRGNWPILTGSWSILTGDRRFARRFGRFSPRSAGSAGDFAILPGISRLLLGFSRR